MREHPIDILMVDDQQGKLRAYEAILDGLGENLLTATSAREAMATLLARDVALVLVDVCMPELDGFELVELIRRHPRFESIPVIFVSAVQLSDVDRLRGYGAGAVDYVAVPVVPQILQAKVRVFAELHRKTRELEALNRELEERIALRTADLEAEGRRKDVFLATLAHELRNPLAPIRSCVQTLRIADLDPTVRDQTERILERQVTHVVRLVDDLIDVSRMTRGTLRLQREPVDLGGVVRATLEASASAQEPEHELRLEVPEVGPYVLADPVRLAQILDNLVDNARKYTPAGGEIAVTVRAEGDDVELRVADSGIGIAPDQLDRIFELFSRMEGTERSRGLGIGLALVRRLVELHEGTVRAHSDGPGRGTELRVSLRRADAPAPAAMDPSRPNVARRRVLVVDDNADAANALAQLLRLSGHEARVAYGGAEALTVGDEFGPEIVLLDLGMPPPDGFETARRLRLAPWGRDVRLLAVTGWGDGSDRRRTSDAGFDGHLVKPIEIEEILERLDPAPCSPLG